MAAGQAFCPISESVFFELLKQSDPQSRREAASLIDELSLGVCLISSRDRMGTELAHFIHTHAPSDKPNALHPLGHRVWSKVACVVALAVPDLPGVDPETVRPLQLRFYNHLWDKTSVVDLVDQVGPSWDADDVDFTRLSHQLNHDVALHKDALTSFKRTYEDEVAGAADICGDLAMVIVGDMARARAIEPAAPGHRNGCN